MFCVVSDMCILFGESVSLLLPLDEESQEGTRLPLDYQNEINLELVQCSKKLNGGRGTATSCGAYTPLIPSVPESPAPHGPPPPPPARAAELGSPGISHPGRICSTGWKV